MANTLYWVELPHFYGGYKQASKPSSGSEQLMIATTVISRYVVRGAVLGVLLVTIASQASAALMAPGGNLLASPEPDPTGGVVVGSTGPLPFATANYSGTLDSTVIVGDPSNPFGPGA